MKDYIEVLSDNNEYKKMEVVTIFNIENYDYNYIIYTELDRSNYYLAKYKGDKLDELSSDFDEKEFEIANEIFKGVVKKWKS